MSVNGTPGGSPVRRWAWRVLFLVVVLLALPFAWELLIELRWSSSQHISPYLRDKLQSEALKALPSGDVPVGSLVLYGDSVIGKGFNTVLAEGNAGGHAEINALSDAMRVVGVARFNAFSRDSLVLVSTYEPCFMCKGALMEARVKHVFFLKPKPFFYRLREDARLLLYTLRMQRREPAELQDSLFRLSEESRRR